MKQAFVYGSLLFLLACGESGTGTSTTRIKKDLATAEKIHNNTSYNVAVYPDTETYIEIKGATDIVKRITADVVDGVLEIDCSKNILNDDGNVEIAIHTPLVGELHVNGSGDMIVQTKFSGDAKNLNARVNGSGNLKILINTPQIDAVVAGSGDLEIIGETKNFTIMVKGSGNYEGYNLLSENVQVDVSGSGNAKVYGSNHIEASINGSGNISYIGTSSINKSVNGSGEIIKGNEKE